MQAAKMVVAVTNVGAAASEDESDNAEPIDEERQVYMAHCCWCGPGSIAVSSRLVVLKRWSSIHLPGAGRSVCRGSHPLVPDQVVWGWLALICCKGRLVGFTVYSFNA